jgi:hypothetical protein
MTSRQARPAPRHIAPVVAVTDLARARDFFELDEDLLERRLTS